MTLLSDRRCQCERRHSRATPRDKPCGMRLVVVGRGLMCACCDLAAERPEQAA